MEWRVRESSKGGFVAEKGMHLEAGVKTPGGIGYMMPAFVVYERHSFDNRRQAEAYIRRRAME